MFLFRDESSPTKYSMALFDNWKHLSSFPYTSNSKIVSYTCRDLWPLIWESCLHKWLEPSWVSVTYLICFLWSFYIGLISFHNRAIFVQFWLLHSHRLGLRISLFRLINFHNRILWKSVPLFHRISQNGLPYSPQSSFLADYELQGYSSWVEHALRSFLPQFHQIWFSSKLKSKKILLYWLCHSRWWWTDSSRYLGQFVHLNVS